HGQADLGVFFESVTPAVAARLKLEPASGVRVTEPKVGAEAHEVAKQLKIDDVIVGYDQHAVTGADELTRLLSRTESGATVEVRVIRHGEEVVLQMHPDASLHDRAVE